MSSRWPRTSSPLLRSSRVAMTLLSPPRPLERLWPTPSPSARRLTSPPWTARRSGFVILKKQHRNSVLVYYLILSSVRNEPASVQDSVHVSVFFTSVSFGSMPVSQYLWYLLCTSFNPQCVVNLEGGKLVCNTGKFCHIQELRGGEMVEVQYILHTHFTTIYHEFK